MTELAVIGGRDERSAAFCDDSTGMVNWEVLVTSTGDGGTRYELLYDGWSIGEARSNSLGEWWASGRLERLLPGAVLDWLPASASVAVRARLAADPVDVDLSPPALRERGYAAEADLVQAMLDHRAEMVDDSDSVNWVAAGVLGKARAYEIALEQASGRPIRAHTALPGDSNFGSGTRFWSLVGASGLTLGTVGFEEPWVLPRQASVLELRHRRSIPTVSVWYDPKRVRHLAVDSRVPRGARGSR